MTPAESQREEILNKVKALWDKYPHYRLGQLLVNFGFGRNDVFYVADAALLDRLKSNS